MRSLNWTDGLVNGVDQWPIFETSANATGADNLTSVNLGKCMKFFYNQIFIPRIIAALRGYHGLSARLGAPPGLLDNVLHALRALRLRDPRNGAMMGKCVR